MTSGRSFRYAITLNGPCPAYGHPFHAEHPRLFPRGSLQVDTFGCGTLANASGSLIGCPVYPFHCRIVSVLRSYMMTPLCPLGWRKVPQSGATPR
jgi:hypothetical protein